MKIGIVCAGDDELEPFLDELQETECMEKAMLKFHVGTICQHDVVAVYSGVCKVNAAIATQIMIDYFNVDSVINAGVAGGMDFRLKIFDTVISTEVAYHDVEKGILTEFHPWMKSVFFEADKNLVQLSRKAVQVIETKGDVFWGRMVTGEAFITDEGRQEIVEAFHPFSIDMETGSIAHVCYVNKTPFIAIRSVTDTAEHSGEKVFEVNCKEAATIAKDITIALLQNM